MSGTCVTARTQDKRRKGLTACWNGEGFATPCVKAKRNPMTPSGSSPAPSNHGHRSKAGVR